MTVRVLLQAAKPAAEVTHHASRALELSIGQYATISVFLSLPDSCSTALVNKSVIIVE